MENTRKKRQERIVEILSLLHNGGSFEEAKKLFDKEFSGVDVSEITAAEKTLIQNGLKPSDIQELCNIHVAVFKGSINEIHHSDEEYAQPGHPVHTLKLENQVLRSLILAEIDNLLASLKAGDWSKKERLITLLEDLSQLDIHYKKKETLIFPYMEKYGITAPPQVMWGVDDDIRAMIKEMLALARSPKVAYNPLAIQWEKTKTEIEEMIFKEEEILVPMTLDVFTLRDWEQIAKDSYEIGFCFIPKPVLWSPKKESIEAQKEREPLRQLAIKEAKEATDAIKEGLDEEKASSSSNSTPNIPITIGVKTTDNPEPKKEKIDFPTGSLRLDELIAIFSSLPVDLTFVDKDDRVRFYSESGSRVFPRTNSVIGREVVNCHPPKSMHIVQQILDDFHAGTRKEANFWFDMRGKKIYIRYFALHDEENNYLGCLEVTQDITDIQELTGQKRLLDEK